MTAPVLDNAAPLNPTVLRAAKRLQQEYDLVLPGRPSPNLTIAAPPWESLGAEERDEWLMLARVAHGVES